MLIRKAVNESASPTPGLVLVVFEDDTTHELTNVTLQDQSSLRTSLEATPPTLPNAIYH